MQTIDVAALEASIERALGMAGGLYQRHPKHPDWETTRPGARTGEIACFVRRIDGEANEYISIVVHEAGEEDEDGYTWHKDCYEIIVDFTDGDSETQVAQSRSTVATIVAEQMRAQ
jgi:hypothetical protein